MALAIAIFTAIAEFMKGAVLLIPDLLKLVHLIVQWFVDRKQREIDAEQAQINNQLKAQADEQSKAIANLKAFKLLIDEAWKTRFAQIVFELEAGKPENVIYMTDEVDNPEVDNILFHSEFSNEIRAMKIVEIMRKNIG